MGFDMCMLCVKCSGILYNEISTKEGERNQMSNNNNDTLAGLCSFLMPGLGQLIQGRVGSGILWFIGTSIGYACFIVPGIIMHICCIVNAANNN